MAFIAPILGAFASYGGFTTAFGLAVGGILLSQAIGPKTPISGRLDNLVVQSSDYGQPIPIVYGEMEVAGNIIWATKITETIKTSGGGFFSKKPKTKTAKHNSSFCIMLCESVPDNYTQDVVKIKANNMVMMDKGGNVITPPDGAAEDHNNIPWKFSQNSSTKVLTESSGQVRIYFGRDNQPFDSMIQADRGSTRVTKNKGVVTMVCENFALDDYGGVVPTFKIRVKNNMTRADMIAKDICYRVGLEDDMMDFSAIADTYFNGFALTNRASAKSYLEQIGQAIFCDFVEIDDKLVAVKRGLDPIVRIEDADVAAHQQSSENHLGIDYTRAQEMDLPRIVEVSYSDIARDWTSNTRSCEKQICNSERKQVVSLPMSMSGERAEQIAQIELFRQWQEGEVYTIKCGWKYAFLTCADVVTITTPMGDVDVRIQEAREDFFGITTYTAVVCETDAYNAPLGSATGDYVPPTVVGYGDYIFGMIPTNAAIDELNEDIGAYLWASVGAANRWEPVVVSNTLINRARPSILTTINGNAETPLPATAGPIQGTVPDWAGKSSTIDTVTVITVDILRGELLSCTEDELYEGENACIVGKEIIQFRNALFKNNVVHDSQTWKRYEISYLLRGRRGTESYMSNHGSNESLVMFDDGIVFVPMKSEALGRTLTFSVDLPGKNVNSNLPVTINGETLMPYSPESAVLTQIDAGGKLDWTRRSRYSDNSLVTGVQPVLGEKSEKYEIDLYRSNGSVYKTYQSATQTLTIPVADINAAYPSGTFGTTPIRVAIYQMSEAVGRGYALDTTLAYLGLV